LTGEIIIADTIQVQPVDIDIFRVSASVMGANDSRINAKTISVLWNQTSGTTAAKELLISAYRAAINPPEKAVKDLLISEIGTVIPE
jgi:hypothetical protein